MSVAEQTVTLVLAVPLLAACSGGHPRITQEEWERQGRVPVQEEAELDAGVLDADPFHRVEEMLLKCGSNQAFAGNLSSDHRVDFRVFIGMTHWHPGATCWGRLRVRNHFGDPITVTMTCESRRLRWALCGDEALDVNHPECIVGRGGSKILDWSCDDPSDEVATFTVRHPFSLSLVN